METDRFDRQFLFDAVLLIKQNGLLFEAFFRIRTENADFRLAF